MTHAPGSGSAITALSPSSGSVGTQVTIHGSGFHAAGNTVSFAASIVEPGQMPNEPSVIPGLSSADGRTIVFNVPAVWRPACSYPPRACPIANIPTAPGAYGVSVNNPGGTSNSVTFLVTR
jgi:IPT/TIG domain-containing protein